MPTDKDRKTNDETEEKSGPSSLIAALARLMQFVDKMESQVSMLNDMSVGDDIKWQTVCAMMKRELEPLKKEVSSNMGGFITGLLKHHEK